MNANGRAWFEYSLAPPFRLRLVSSLAWVTLGGLLLIGVSAYVAVWVFAPSFWPARIGALVIFWATFTACVVLIKWKGRKLS